MSEGTKSKDLERARLRNEALQRWAIILGIVLSFTTAISAHFKEEQETTAKGVYKELSAAVEKNSENVRSLHQDMAAIRGYLAGQADTKGTVSFFDIFKNNRISAMSVSEDRSTSDKTIAVTPKIGVSVKPLDSPPPKVITPEPETYKSPPIEQVTATEAE